jgi:hypothetical protein
VFFTRLDTLCVLPFGAFGLLYNFELVTFVDCAIKALVVILMVFLNKVKFITWLDTCLIVESRYNCSLDRRVLANGAYFLALSSSSVFSGSCQSCACTWT